MAKVEGIEKVRQALQTRIKSAQDAKVSVSVGYSAEARYAIFVHENTQMVLAGKPRPSGLGEYWGPAGAGPKFLERPARELAGELAKIIRSQYAKTRNMGQALLMAGLRLQRESQQLVPVEYGNLKRSAFTRLNKGS